MIYSSWDIEQNKLKLVILCHFLPFIPLKTPKVKILKNKKICCTYHHFTHVQQKSQSYDVRFLRYRVRQTKNFLILGHFLPFYHPHSLPLMISNIKILKKMKKCLVMLSFYTEMCTINKDHIIHGSWNIGYRVWQAEIFNILSHVLPFQPFGNLENQNFNIEKNTWRYYHFTHLHHKWQSYDVWFLRYGAQQT